MTAAHAHLEQIGREWQRRLKLQDWTIEFVLAESLEDTDGAFGTSNWVLHKRYATITVLGEKLREELSPFETITDTVRHELLHLHLAPLDLGERLNRMVIEHAIDAIVASYRSSASECIEVHC